MFNIITVEKITGSKTGRMSFKFEVIQDYGCGKTVITAFLQNKNGKISELYRKYSLDLRLEQVCKPGNIVNVDDLVEVLETYGYDVDHITVYDTVARALVWIFVCDKWNSERRDIFVEKTDVGNWMVIAIVEKNLKHTIK